jgi:DNA polymerase-1
LEKWKRYVEWHVNRYGFIDTPLGRRRYFSVKNEEAIRQAVNMPVQSLASDFMLLGLIATNKLIKERGLDAKLLNEVHDQLVGETPLEPESNIIELGRAIRDGMLDLRWPLSKEPFNWFTVPAKVDLEWGLDMGNLKELEV